MWVSLLMRGCEVLLRQHKALWPVLLLWRLWKSGAFEDGAGRARPQPRRPRRARPGAVGPGKGVLLQVGRSRPVTRSGLLVVSPRAATAAAPFDLGKTTPTTRARAGALRASIGSTSKRRAAALRCVAKRAG